MFWSGLLPTSWMLVEITSKEQALLDWAMAVLSTVFHSRGANGVASARATLEALHEVDPDDLQIYIDLVTVNLNAEQLQQIPKCLLNIDPKAPLGPMELSGAYYVRGRTEGLEEGRKEGMQSLVLDLLAARFGRLSQRIQRRVKAITSGEELRKLAGRIAKASSLKELGLV